MLGLGSQLRCLGWLLGSTLGIATPAIAASEPVSALAPASAPNSAPASDTTRPYRELSLEELAAIPVDSGSFLELDQLRSPMSVTIIDRRQIEISGARNLSELLEIHVPGFQYMINKWNGVVWGMRGVAADRNTKILFLVNGQALNLESSHGAYSEPTLGLLGDIERVEVLRGPAGMVYGSGSIAGVVNVVTRGPSSDRAAFELSYDTMGRGEADASTRVDLGHDHYATLSFGFLRARGLQAGQARVYGAHERPKDGAVSPRGEPTDGPAWSTPGNLRGALDLNVGPLRIYARYTRQQFPTGQFFITDPWPEYIGDPPPDAPLRKVDGRWIGPDHPLANTESFGNNRRLHIVENLAVGATMAVDLGPDQFQARLQWAGATDQLRVDDREGFGGSGALPQTGAINTSFGERRYTLGLRYLFQRIDRLKFAVGGEYRLDDIGRDLAGRNMFAFSEAHPFVDEVVYHNVSVYSEWLWEAHPMVMVEAGLRVDKHTRTTWIANPRASLIVTPDAANAVKLVFQSSSNNGQAEFYEHDWTSYTPDGDLQNEARLEHPLDPESAILRRSHLEDRRNIVPERAYSLELTSTHRALPGLTLIPTLAWSQIDNLFAWNADLQRVVNSGDYSFITAEAEIGYQLDSRLRVGFSHSYQRVVDASLEGTEADIEAVRIVANADGTYSAETIPDQTIQVETHGTRDQITRSGKHFLNLSSHSTKLQIDWRPLPWLTLATHLRMFYGLPGRRRMLQSDLRAGENYLGLARRDLPMTKWSISARVQIAPHTSLSIHLRDILGDADNLHAVRYQQMSAPLQRGLYTVDQRSIGATLRHGF